MNITKRCAQHLISPAHFLLSNITLELLKLRPIINQTGTYIYKASKVVAKYVGPPAKNKYILGDTLVS